MKLRIDQIITGERDRSDLGDIDGLAESIKAVGLLHPVVVTASHELVAGDRRLAAVKRLGWAEVPVTVVDLTTAYDVLRAESDENTCRKGLTPIEASRARERRSRVLSEDAAKRKREHSGSEPGQQGGGRDVASKLDATSARRSARATRKLGAVGTGYSGSTLDKVDRVRHAAERGTVTSHGKTVEVPEPVREIARQGVRDLEERKVRPDRAMQQVEEALNDYLDSDAEIARARLDKNVTSAISKARHLLSLDAENVGATAGTEAIDAIEDHHRQVTAWVEKVRASRPNRLRAIK